MHSAVLPVARKLLPLLTEKHFEDGLAVLTAEVCDQVWKDFTAGREVTPPPSLAAEATSAQATAAQATAGSAQATAGKHSVHCHT